jgi:hypothetical protein
MRRWYTIALLATLPVSGCASDFQVPGFSGGTDVQQLSTGLFRVSASGGPTADYAAVQDRLLLKAAETTLQHGGTHFLVRATPTRYAPVGIVTGDISPGSAMSDPRRYRRASPIQDVGGGQEAYIEILSIPPGQEPPVAAISAQEITTFVGRRSP